LEIDMSKASQRGFTLIELVVVIVILGVLAAFAVPRFMGLETQARKATLNGLAGSVRSAAALAHSTQLAQGLAPGATIKVNNVDVTMTNGYPTAADLSKTLEDTTGFTVAAGVFTKDGAEVPANCSVTYAPPAAAGGAITVTVDPSKC
jgi:MSHA pilin protein MshA